MKLLVITQKINKDDPILGFFHDWIKEFSKHFEFITTICLEKGNYELPSNVKILSLGKEKINDQSAINNQQFFIKFKYIIRFWSYIWKERKNYDAVFVHMNPVYIVLGILIWKITKKSVYLWYTHKNVDFKLRIAEKFVDKIFTASKESFRLLSNKVNVVGHGIDTDFFCPLNRVVNYYKILSVGRISKIKNQLLMVEAIAKLVDQYPNVSLTIIGDPITKEDFNYREKIEDKIREFKLENHVFLIGSVNPRNIVEYYQRSDLFINLSSTGSMDKAVLEAMSCGNKVLTSNEAFRSILPPENCTDNNIENISIGVKRLLIFPIDNSLREYVVANHQLRILINNLSMIIKKL